MDRNLIMSVRSVYKLLKYKYVRAENGLISLEMFIWREYRVISNICDSQSMSAERE